MPVVACGSATDPTPLAHRTASRGFPSRWPAATTDRCRWPAQQGTHTAAISMARVADADLDRGIGVAEGRQMSQRRQRGGRAVVAEQPVQLVWPSRPGRRVRGVVRGNCRYNVRRTWVTLRFAHRGLLGGQEMTCVNGPATAGRDGVQHHRGVDVPAGGVDLGVQRNRRRRRGDDLQIAVQPQVQRLGVQDDQARAGQQDQDRCGETARSRSAVARCAAAGYGAWPRRSSRSTGSRSTVTTTAPRWLALLITSRAVGGSGSRISR